MPKPPLLINIAAMLIILSGLMGGYAGWVDPKVFFAFMEGVDWADPNLQFLNGLWGTRNIGLVIVLTAGLVLQNAWVLWSGFLARTVIETQDMFILAPGRLQLPDTPPAADPSLFDQVMAVFPLAVFAIELIALIWLSVLLFRGRSLAAQ